MRQWRVEPAESAPGARVGRPEFDGESTGAGRRSPHTCTVHGTVHTRGPVTTAHVPSAQHQGRRRLTPKRRRKIYELVLWPLETGRGLRGQP